MPAEVKAFLEQTNAGGGSKPVENPAIQKPTRTESPVYERPSSPIDRRWTIVGSNTPVVDPYVDGPGKETGDDRRVKKKRSEDVPGVGTRAAANSSSTNEVRRGAALGSHGSVGVGVVGVNAAKRNNRRDKEKVDERGRVKDNDRVERPRDGVSGALSSSPPKQIPSYLVHGNDNQQGRASTSPPSANLMSSSPKGGFFPSLFNRWNHHGQAVERVSGSQQDRQNAMSWVRRPLGTHADSNMRRKVVTRERPPSGGTISSVGGTVISGVEAPGEVPLILRKCIKLIEEIGLEVEGLYRISGKAATVEHLKRLFAADATRVHLHPPPNVSPLISSLIQDAPSSSTARRSSRLSLDTQSSRTSLDESALTFVLDSNAKRSTSHNRDPHVKTNASVSQKGRGADTGAKVKHGLVGGMSGTKSSSKGGNASSSFANSDLYDSDVHVVTGVVKGFLRDGLPPKKEPVGTYELYEDFIKAAGE
ncbi:hypothetical protein HDU76_010241 [Blyttiomyces sp. JEL0837]|nr:hypothetical protein HDU76_010241 [Blyttiomyces sp. JEL0837]